jgi:ribonuclease BN (tRNA processing enzyme)
MLAFTKPAIAETHTAANGMPEVYVQVVGAGTGGISPSVLVVAGRHRFLFNCGEQSQRFITENKLRTQNLDAVFFTQVDWHHLGGLSDLLMTGTPPNIIFF